MTPFFDRGQFIELPTPQTNGKKFNPDKNGSGVEIRYGRDIKKRSSIFYISSGKWTEMQDDGLIDQEIEPGVIGELIDPLGYSPCVDQDERKSATEILESGEIIIGQTLDYEGEANKDGRITVFHIRARGYVSNEEIPQSSRGLKAINETIIGYSVGTTFNPFFDGGESTLGIPREGFYGNRPEATVTFEDRDLLDGLGYQIDTGDYDEEYQTGAFGTILYSSKLGTDSIAFAGLLR